MIVASKTIYAMTANKHNMPIDFIESVGNCVFEELRKSLNDPLELAYELPKLGTFNVRFDMMDDWYLSFLKRLNNNDPLALQQRDENPELFFKATNLHRKMEEYRAKKREAKIKRHGQSQDNSTEH